jgi:hybrid cluster-associated redox disulfide protein
METTEVNVNGATAAPIFHADMTVGEAMQLHPRAREVFAGFHLGGCAHCSISEFETIRQICEGYGVPADMLLGALNGLDAVEPAAAPSAPTAQ